MSEKVDPYEGFIGYFDYFDINTKEIIEKDIPFYEGDRIINCRAWGYGIYKSWKLPGEYKDYTNGRYMLKGTKKNNRKRMILFLKEERERRKKR